MAPVSAQEIIRCPDWQRYVSPAVLRSEQAAPGAFDAKLRQARPSGVANISSEHDPNVQGDGRVGAVPPCTYVIRSGDTLGAIAARHLGGSRHWPEIARVNPGLDPNRLRVGTRLTLPCGQRARQGSMPGAPLAGTGFLARLSGQTLPGPEGAPGNAAKAGDAKPAQKASASSKPQSTAQSKSETSAKTTKANRAAQKPAAKKPTPAAKPVPPPPPPLPVWTARKGEDFAAVLKRWGKQAGYRVVTGTTDAWTLAVPVRLQADFETAVNQLVQGLGSDGTAPPVRIYSNRVVRLGGL